MEVVNGVIVIAGARGVGKTTLACEYAPPSKISRVFYHGSERSGNRFRQQLIENDLDFGYHSELSSRFADLPSDEDIIASLSKNEIPWRTSKQKSSMIELFEFIMDDLNNNLQKGAFDVYIHDTIALWESSMIAWADEHSKELGVSGNSVKGSKGGEYWTAGYYVLYDQLFEAIFKRGVETIILTTHLKKATEGRKQIPGKVVPGGKPWLNKQTSLAIWLVNEGSNPDGAPAGLVLKERLGRTEVLNDEWVTRRTLPRRIPHCSWKDIRNYMENPANLAEPADGERFSPREVEMISPMATDKQMELMIADAMNGHREDRPTYGGEDSAPVVFVDADVEKQKENLVSLLETMSGEEAKSSLLSKVPPPLRKKVGGHIDQALKLLEGK